MANPTSIPNGHDKEHEEKLDLFDPRRFRLSQDFGATMVAGEKLVATVPVRKPDAQTYFRVHPGDDFSLETAVIELKEDRETYLIEPELISELAGELKVKKFHTVMTRQGVLMLWGVPLATVSGSRAGNTQWASSAALAAENAKTRWVRMKANMSLGAYEIFVSRALELGEPRWPDLSFAEILRIAFGDFRIDSLDHPIVKRLRGEL